MSARTTSWFLFISLAVKFGETQGSYTTQMDLQAARKVVNKYTNDRGVHSV